MFRRSLIAATAGALALPDLARAQALPKITIGMSGWTGFAPLTLAEQAGLFKANGIEVETKFVPQRERNLALASGALNCVVTTVDTMILWASTIPLVQVLVLDRSKGGDGLGARPNIGSIADLKGKTIAVDGVGTCALFPAGLHAAGERADHEGRADRDAGAAAGRAGLRRRASSTPAPSYEPYLSQVRGHGRRQGEDPGDHRWTIPASSTPWPSRPPSSPPTRKR